jgi:protein SCO1/2
MNRLTRTVIYMATLSTGLLNLAPALADNPAAADPPAANQPPLQPPQAKLLANVHFNQKLGAQVPLDLPFTDDAGRRIVLGDCLHDRPTILVLAYYRCPMLCNQVLEGLARSLKAVDLKPGADFDVVVASFDPSDTVDLAAGKKKSVLAAYNRKADPAGWYFLVGEHKSIAALADAVGFGFQYDPATNQFAHASGIMVVTPAGRVSHYFFGIDYPTRDVRLALVEASAGRIGNAVDQLLLYCFHYDPLTGRYGLAIMRLIRAGGALTVLGLAAFIWTSLRRERRGRQLTPDAAADNPSPSASA